MIFVAETLRKHPVGGNITRIATKPYKVPDTNFTIPKGMKVYVPVFAIHHDETYYPNPEEFNPDRWISGGDNIPTKGAFLPFGDGTCIFLTFYYFVTHCEVLPFNSFPIFCINRSAKMYRLWRR